MKIVCSVPLWKRIVQKIIRIVQEIATIVLCIIGVMWIAIMVGIGMIREGED